VIGSDRCADGASDRATHDRTVPATEFIADYCTRRSANAAAKRRVNRRVVCLGRHSGQGKCQHKVLNFHGASRPKSRLRIT